MDNKIVLDSCVFNKLFLQEPETDKAIALINHLTAKSYQILAPSLFLYEVLAVAKISKVDTQQIYAIIMKLQNLGLQLIELNSAMIERALSICDVGHDKSGFPSFYDASYHALAILNACYFVTADKRHFSKTQDLGNIILLSNWEKFLI
jgi:predicted nucleic acid-binding protein